VPLGIVQRVEPVPQVVVNATHAPALHTGAESGHCVAQEPQARGSDARLRHAVVPNVVVHCVEPGRQAHAPEPLQYCSSLQLLPHAPQLFGSSIRSRQTPLQFVVATGEVGHEQVLDVHVP